MSHPPAPSRAQSPHVCAPSLPANARHGPIVYKGCHYRFSIMTLIVGRECSLCARWVLVGWVCRAPAPLRRANVARARPSPLPSRSPPPKRAPLGQSGVPPLAVRFYAGARPSPLPPRPPPPICVRLCVCVFVRGFVCGFIQVRGRCRCSGPLGLPASCALWPACRMPPDVPRPPPPSSLALRVWSRGAPSGPLGGPLARPL